MTLKAKRIECREAIYDLNPRDAPETIAQRRWDEGEPRGRRERKDLAWHRGVHAGWIEAILVLQEMGDPGSKLAASRLQKHFNLNDKGAIVGAIGDEEEKT